MPFKTVAALLMERTALRNNLSEHKEIHVKPGDPTPKIKVHSTQYINDCCRAIQPYQEPIQWLNSAVGHAIEGQPGLYFYDQPIDYEYVHPIYFSSYLELIDEIVSSNEKWLIFVDTENEGIDLVGRLNQIDVSSLYLSAKTRRKKGSAEYEEFCNIVQTQHFNCKVLVATSVLDCGVSITDPLVTKIVISHSDRTTFIQMLGRRRICNSESITLYIKNYSATTINSLRYNCEKKLQFLVFFHQINEIHYDKIKLATASDDGMRGRSELPTLLINQVIQQLPSNKSLVYSPRPFATAWYGPYSRPEAAVGLRQILEEYKPSQTALINLLYSFDILQQAIEEHRITQDPVFYLKLQLSWIGKTYDPTCWFGYERIIRALRNYLDDYCTSGRWLNKLEQVEFSNECWSLLKRYPVPTSSIKTASARFRKNPDLILGKNAFNKIFTEIGLPYRIESKQSSSKYRNSLWQIILTE